MAQTRRLSCEGDERLRTTIRTSAMELSILNLLVVLVVAWVAGRFAHQLGYPSVLGELLAGIILGPPLLGLIEGGAALAVLAEVGILLMMVYIGMEIDPRELGKASRAGLLAAVGGFLTPFVLCYFAVLAFGGTQLAAVFVGVAAGVTSLATKSRILVDLQLLDTRVAHVMMAGALIADTVSLIIFAAVLGVAETTSFDVQSLAVIAMKALAFFAVAAFVGLKVFPRVGGILRSSAALGRTSSFMLVLIIALAFAEMAHLAGLHGILGAFMAGLFLREGVFGKAASHELMETVRDASIGFLAPIFFVTAGFAVSLEVFQTDLKMLGVVVALATFGKIAGTALFYLPTGHGWREGLTVGAGMNGRGAVEIIIAQIGLSMGLITQEIFSILVFMAIFTTATVPILLKLGTDWLRRRDELVRSSDERAGVLIVGGGPVARTLGRLLVRSQSVCVVDVNEDNIVRARADGMHALDGNALDEQVLAAAGAASVKTALLLTSNADVNALAAKVLRSTFLVPEILILGDSGPEGRSVLQHLDAHTLFGGRVDLLAWDYRVDHALSRENRLPVDAAESAVAVYERVTSQLDGLPLAVRREDNYLPFHDGLDLLPSDSIVALNVDLDVLPPRLDRFDRLVARAPVLDLDQTTDRDHFFELSAAVLAPHLNMTPDEMAGRLADREHRGSTIILPGLAIPHIVIEGTGEFALLIARCRDGVSFPDEPEHVHALFVLVGTEDERSFYLRALSAIAQIVQRPNFDVDWLTAWTAEDLRRLILHSDRRRFDPVGSQVTADRNQLNTPNLTYE